MSAVPIKVKGRGSQNVVTTYALLVSGSTGIFCSESLLEQLDIKGRKCAIFVSTIGNVVANCQKSIFCLEVIESLQPHDVPNSENGGPYAIQTVFGWALNGPRKVALYRNP